MGRDGNNMKDKNSYNSLFIVVLIFIVITVLLFLFSPGVLGSNFFVAFITFLVGTFVIYLYIAQKNDHKRDAANIVLMELRHAENIIDQTKGGEILEVSQALLPTNNWTKYNYLFIGDLDRDELDLINNFYNQCELIDKAATQMSISTQLEQKANHIHNEIVKLAMEESKLYSSEADALNGFNIKKEKFLKVIHSDGYAFRPADPQNKIIKSLFNIQKITTSSAGNILKKIAKLK